MVVAVEHAAPRHGQRHHARDAHIRHQPDDHGQRECDVLAAEPGFGGFHDFGLVGQQQCHGARHAHRVERFQGCVEDENSMHVYASGIRTGHSAGPSPVATDDSEFLRGLEFIPVFRRTQAGDSDDDR